MSENSFMGHRALVAGATGLIGGHLVRRLSRANDYEGMIVLTRRSLSADEGVEMRLVNFDALTPADCAGADVVFCALGTTIKKAGSQEQFRRVDFGYVKALAEASHAAGSEQFVMVSSVGADARASNFYLRVKGEAEEAVKAVGFNAVHIFRPSLLLGNRPEARFGEAIGRAVMPGINPLLIGSWKKYRAVSAEQVAAALAAAPLRPAQGPRVYEYDEIAELSGRC
jgi:uncharacterized protein YbjT (DUF2867 family)